MIRRLTIIAIAIFVAACAGTAPPPAVAPTGEARYLIDPRTGFTGAVAPNVDRRFDDAWRYFLAGDAEEASRRLAEIRSRNPEYTPAALGQAAVDIVKGDLDTAASIVRDAEAKQPNYTAARVYDAEIAAAHQDTQHAYDLYTELSQQPNAPAIAAERAQALRDQLFNELFARAQKAQGTESTTLLRDALAINAAATEARVQLANRLLADKSYDEALQVLTPLNGTPEGDRPDVQAALAEIEVGRGDYQAAITRYDRLAKMTRGARYTQRLNELKELWNEANMPPQYQRAIESPSIDRADFAVLLYWKLTSVRFAQNLGTPPIAIDIENVPGRDEMIRAMALGLYDVDPVTRRVSPNRPITAATLAKLGARVLAIGGANCARAAANPLAACGIADPQTGVPPDAPVTGKQAATMVDQIEVVLPR
ncbi:MAG TPA: hypothetical protein VLU46_06745 [Thermoanaerobaculia bacterium]|nr:hypothetical protein [Thermoanaerobaculia bacterium]